MIPMLCRYVAGTLLEITYGQRLTSMNDLIVQLAERAVNGTNESGSPGSMLVDFFPIRESPGNRAELQYVLIAYAAPALRLAVKHLPTWLPIAGFKRHALKAREDLNAWKNTGLNLVRSAMVSRAPPRESPCIINVAWERRLPGPHLPPSHRRFWKRIRVTLARRSWKISRRSARVFMAVRTFSISFETQPWI